MPTDQNAMSFFFEGSPVGYFEGDELPTLAGRYRFMPYRTRGNFRLQTSLKTSGPQRRYYTIQSVKHYFTVLACPSYGLVELAAFDTLSSSAP
jgi:hypothetical protein